MNILIYVAALLVLSGSAPAAALTTREYCQIQAKLAKAQAVAAGKDDKDSLFDSFWYQENTMSRCLDVNRAPSCEAYANEINDDPAREAARAWCRQLRRPE